MRLLTGYGTVLLLLSVLVSGCVSTGRNRITPEFPKGKFQAHEPGDRVTLDFTDPGEFTVNVNGRIVDWGIYTISGNEITWETSMYCKARGSESATYTWTLDNDTLKFQVKGQDNCGPRFDDFQYTYERLE